MLYQLSYAGPRHMRAPRFASDNASRGAPQDGRETKGFPAPPEKLVSRGMGSLGKPMEIVYHVGAHGSDHDRIIRTLLRNRDNLWKQGIEVPAPNRYRGVLGEAVSSLKGRPAPPEMQEMLLDAVMDSDQAKRLVLSQTGFLGMPNRVVSAEGLYPRSHHRLTGLSNLFPDSVVEFFIGLVHPARQIAALVRMTNGRYDALMAGVDPRKLQWTPLILRMLQTMPDRDIVVWAQEDLPFTWPEVLRRMAGVAGAVPLIGEDAVLSDLLPAEPLAALNARIAAAPGLSIAARRDMVEEALAGADEAVLETPIDLPGWSQDLIDDLSAIYAEDLARIAALTGVEFISA